MRRQSSVIGVAAGVAVLFLVLPPLANRCDAQVLQYVVRANPFEVQLTLADGAKQTTQPRREQTYLYFLSEQGWPVPEGASEKRVRCDIRREGFPADWRLGNTRTVEIRSSDSR
jgi:hypothetical protein